MKLIDSFRNYILDEEFKIQILKNQVNIVNYSNIINFTSKEIIVKCDDIKVTVTGNELIISRLLANEVLISGVIEKIEFR